MYLAQPAGSEEFQNRVRAEPRTGYQIAGKRVRHVLFQPNALTVLRPHGHRSA
jgi:hypothetical protein